MALRLSKRFFGVISCILGMALMVALVIAFSIAKDVQQINRQGDAALFEQVVESIYLGKGAVSNVFANTQNFIDKGYAFVSIGELVGRDLTPPSADERNMLKFHAYLILFALAPFLAFVQSSLLLTFAQSLCFFGLIATVAMVAFRQTKSVWVSILMSGIVLVNSNWIGGLLGQFYPDRLFVLTGFLVCWAAWKRELSTTLVCLALLTALINERAALIAGIAITACAMSHDEVELRQPRSWQWRMILVGVVLLAYAYLEKTYVLDNVYYGGGYLPGSFSELKARLSDSVFQRNIGTFISNNFVLLLLSIGAPRLALLGFIVMTPNLIGNIGGAEKTGWLTHYHSYYFPILAFSATIGASNIYLFLKRKFNLSPPFVSAIYAVVIGLGVLLVNKTILQYDNEVVLSRVISLVRVNFSNWIYDLPTGYAIRDEAKSMFLPGTHVLTTEVGMALLNGHVRIGVFPVALEKSDAIFIPCNWLKQGPPGYLHPPYEFINWLASKGFDVAGSVRLNSIDHCAVYRGGHN